MEPDQYDDMYKDRPFTYNVDGGDKIAFVTEGAFVTKIHDSKNQSPLRAGDKILSINSQPTYDMDDNKIKSALKQPKLLLVIERDFVLPEKMPPAHSAMSLKKPVHKTERSSKSEMLCVLDEEKTEEYDYGILVLGVTGVGKSSMCNFFFRKDVFHVEPGVISCTPVSAAHCHSINNKNIMFIDSPGFSDAIISNKERMKEMAKALLLARNGVHAIIICLNGSKRFTEADESAISELKQLKTRDSQSIWNHTFVVFTHGRSMGKEEQQRYKIVDKWKHDAKCPPLFKELLDKIQNRFIVVESLMEETSNYYIQKCDELVRFIDEIYAVNNKTCYTHRLFTWAKDKYEEAAKKQKKIIEEKAEQQEDIIKKHLDLLEKNSKLMEKLEAEKSEQAKNLKAIENELNEAKIQLNDKDHKISQYEENIKTIKENETKKLEAAYNALKQVKQEKLYVEEKVESKQKESANNKRAIDEIQQKIETERNEKEQLQQQLKRKEEYMNILTEKFKQFLHDKQIRGESETLDEALELMVKDIDTKQEELAAGNEEVTRLTDLLEIKEREVKRKGETIRILEQHIETSLTTGISFFNTDRRLFAKVTRPQPPNQE